MPIATIAKDAPPTKPIPPTDVAYSFVTSICSSDFPQRHEKDSSIRIKPEVFAEDNGSYICGVDFKWREFNCEFTCLYHPSTGTYSDFEIEPGTMAGGMEQIERISVLLDQKTEQGDDIVKTEIKDDNGNPFLFVLMDFGFNGCLPMAAQLYGKKVQFRENVGDSVLSEAEKRRLGLCEIESEIEHEDENKTKDEHEDEDKAVHDGEDEDEHEHERDGKREEQ